MNKIIGAFKADVFRIKGIDKKDVVKKPQTKEELLKNYIQRLNDDRNLETVRN